MSYQFIDVTTQGRVTRITMNRPEVLNALHAAMHDEMQAALDSSCRGSGGVYCIKAIFRTGCLIFY